MFDQIEHSQASGLEIAVIGMAGRFPGARNIDIFWENLKNGVESISFFSVEELEEAGVKPDLPQNPNSSHSVTYLRDEYDRMRRLVESVSGNQITDDDLRRSDREGDRPPLLRSGG